MHSTSSLAAVVLVAALVSACSSVPVPTHPNGDAAAAKLLDIEVAKKIKAHTMAEDVEAPTPILAGPLVTIDSYQGDAATLLSRIAAANGRSFEITGTEPRLPLFIHVDVRNADLKSVLADIGAQFGGRADLVLTHSHIKINYKRAKTL